MLTPYNCIHSAEATIGHGRIEERFTNLSRAEDLDMDPSKWSYVLRIFEVIVKTTDKRTNKEAADSRLYISNLDSPADVIGILIRQHWRIGNNHWHLDWNFKQDQADERFGSEEFRHVITLVDVIHIHMEES